jgi:predicted ATP-dependent protease
MPKKNSNSGPPPPDIKLPADALRWTCPPSWLPFSTTLDVEPLSGVVGQEEALAALRFGLEMSGPGQNVFVRGLSGSGRLTLVCQLVEEMRPPCPPTPDRSYVHNFSEPEVPRLISLPRGEAPGFEAAVDNLVHFIRDELGPFLASDAVRSLRTSLDDRTQERIRRIGQPFDDELQKNGLALVPVEVGQILQPVILPVVDGKPAPPDRFKELRQQGKISDEEAEAIHKKISDYSRRFQDVSQKLEEVQDEHKAEIRRLYETQARVALRREVRPIEAQFPYDAVRRFLAEIIEDVVTRRLKSLENEEDFSRLYRVNVLITRDPSAACPIVIENAPTLPNLLGTVEREFNPGSVVRSDHLMVRAGTLLRADGGYLILEARDVLMEPGAWKVLVRTLRTGKLEIVPSEMVGFSWGPLLKPEAIEINIKVVLLGDPDLYYMLDEWDADFPHLFKILSDFDTTVLRNERSARYYAGVVAHAARQEKLLSFSNRAVAILCEHGARIAARRDRMTIRFGRILDIAREASFIARKKERNEVTEEEVREAITLSKRRGDLPARRFRDLVRAGTIRIQIEGEAVGQVNGLAVIQAGPMIYGFPTRITATIGPGTAGTIDIEREAQLSGAIHTKGFYILGGLLRHLLRTPHPLAFSASIAFEQSYGGIDGDSASGAEMCCLLSALTGVPLRQDLAMTGAIDQLGHIQPVGAVTEKIEGFFDTCRDLGLSGTQGVIIPRANAGDLMLREDVVTACREGRFTVYAVEGVEEALTLLTGWKAGERDKEGRYPSNSLLGLAEQKAFEYWVMASASATRTEALHEVAEAQAQEGIPEEVAARKAPLKPAGRKKP